MSPIALTLILISTLTHASWNLMAHARRSGGRFLLWTLLVISGLGVVPALALELIWPILSPGLWWLAAVSCLCQVLYWLGLMKGYERGDFTVVYPLARALPILAVALVDIGRSRDPSAWGWLGIALTVVGCLVMPLQSLRSLRPRNYCNATMFWVLVTAAATAGYTSIDKISQEIIREVLPGPFGPARYCALIVGTAGLVLVPIVSMFVSRQGPARQGRRQWFEVAAAGLLVWVTYALVQWAYQLTEHASYVLAVRQFSIVVGVVVAAFIFQEPAPRLRIAGAAIITVGVVCIGLSR